MSSISTHVLNAAVGGAQSGVPVTVEQIGGPIIASGTTDTSGRIVELATALGPGPYRVRWALGGRQRFLHEVAIVVYLDEERHYHLPLLATPASAVSYLGA